MVGRLADKISLLPNCKQLFTGRHSSIMEDGGQYFLAYATEFVLFLAVLENSVLPMG